jgi:hypothetical protein
MLRSTRHDALFLEHYRARMTAEDLLARLSVEGRAPWTSGLRDFRKLRTDVRLRYIRGFLRERPG